MGLRRGCNVAMRAGALIQTGSVRKNAGVFCAALAILFVLVFRPFEFSFMRVISGSMEPEYPVNALVLIHKNSPFEKLKTGDVILFRSDALNGKPALHRVIAVTEQGVYTKGDANRFGDKQPVTKEVYAGKAVAKSIFFARYTTVMRKPAGVLLFFLLPVFACAALYFSIRYFKRR